VTPPDPTLDPPALPAGLCGTCRHSRRVETAQGSIFRLCERSTSDARYPRYPTLPVLRCDGFQTVVPDPR